MNKHQLTKHFHSIRIRRKLTQENVAIEAGISLKWYQQIENGLADTRLSDIDKILNVLKVSLKDIVLYDENLGINNTTNNQKSDTVINYGGIEHIVQLYEKLLKSKDIIIADLRNGKVEQ